MRIYKDGLGRKYHVSDDQVEEFERRRRPMLIAAIVIKLVFLAILIYVINF